MGGVVLGAFVVLYGASLAVRPVHRPDLVVPDWPHIGVARPASHEPRSVMRSCGTPLWAEREAPRGCHHALRDQRRAAEFTVLGGFLVAAATVRLLPRREE